MLLTSGRCERNVAFNRLWHSHHTAHTRHICHTYKQTNKYKWTYVECVHITCCCKLLSFRTFSKAFQRQTYIHIDRLIFVCVLFTHKHTHTHVQMCSFTHLRGISNYICMYVFAASVATPESYSQKLAGHMHTYIHIYAGLFV